MNGKPFITPYSLAGFESGSSVLKAYAMTTVPRGQAHIVAFCQGFVDLVVDFVFVVQKLF
jgi:hypothetical protein